MSDSRKPGTQRRFLLYRREDATGVSGTGSVAEGVEWCDGTVSMRWCVEGKPRGTTFYNSAAEVEEIHGHDGRTQIVWDW